MTVTSLPAPAASLAARAARVMPGGVSSPVRALHETLDRPLLAASCRGARLTDADGNSYLDYIGGWGAAILGHAHPAVVEAVHRAAHDGLSPGATTRLEISLAEAIAERIPGVEQVRFVCSGTEAVMSAVRLARAVTGRVGLVRFSGGYHGHSEMLLADPSRASDSAGEVTPDGVTRAAAAPVSVLPYNDEAAVREHFAHHGPRVACVVVEPVAGNMGVVPATPAFLRTLRELTTAHGALLIFDEVITGFRVAWGGAQELTGVQADLVTLGKIVGGGLPAAAYAGPASLMRSVAPLGPMYQAGTLAGHPLAMAAGLATLAVLDRGAYQSLDAAGAMLEAGVQAGLERWPGRACVQRVGSMLTLFFGVDRVTSWADARRVDTTTFAEFYRGLRAGGVLIPPSAQESWFLSTAHDTEHLQHTIAVVHAALRAGAETWSDPFTSP